ncbi:CPBP family intramembrane metalloprotease [Sphingomonas sp. BT-65]|uniref:CPBP family intramembrane glutamic endopeptidase n=1 Tax=Sphingomonas sp. BT-65 TaxID=2989821 RepID=UPI0022367380|nr:CPBP family intramembrane glutamic endopeptidase [Sphingomonas sp. BT-65]MCW4462826.1 CPBP family intramembrane metalloprotease [Sphingomonas sp. BT-65]
MNWALLLGLIAAYTWYIRGGGVPPGSGRIARYRRWMRRAPLAFGGSALLALAIAGRIGNLWQLPAEFAGLEAEARHFAGFGGNMATLKIAVLVGFVGGAALGLAVSRWQVRRGRRPFTAGDIERILPQRGGEFGWTAALGIAAGIVEELFFRLALPLFAAVATGNAGIGFALATLLFAAAHRYQGWTGMAFSGVAGTLLAILYLATGELWFAMLIHALLNLNGLVLRPAVLRRRDD